MTAPEDESTPQAMLPEDLLARLEVLDRAELSAVHEYVEARLEAPGDSLKAAIEAEAAGELVDVEVHGSRAVVRQHPPDPEGNGVDTDTVALYHVRREHRPDGEDSLHWVYLGDVQDGGRTRCPHCNETFETTVPVCPSCGSEAVTHPDRTE